MALKLFRFYPNNYCRMYVLGESKEDVLGRQEELFRIYVAEVFPWCDDTDDEYLQDKYNEFIEGIQYVLEVPSGVAVDSHY